MCDECNFLFLVYYYLFVVNYYLHYYLLFILTRITISGVPGLQGTIENWEP